MSNTKDKECCCLDCPPGSSAKLVSNTDGPGNKKCECVCDNYPVECTEKYLRTDPYGKVKVWLSPRDPWKVCKGTIPAKFYEFTGEPCSCLCKDINYEDICGHTPGAIAPVDSHSFVKFPYTGKIDPRGCDCEKLCSEDCGISIIDDYTKELILEYAGPGSTLAIDGWPDGAVFNDCRNPSMCCVDVAPTSIDQDQEGTPRSVECSAFCDPDGKTQCCSIRLEIKANLNHLPNLTFCCKECERCVLNQSFNAHCEPIPDCVPSPQLPQAPQKPILLL